MEPEVSPVEPGGPTVKPGGPTVEPGGPTVKPGGPTSEPARPTVEPGGSPIESGAPTAEPRGPAVEPEDEDFWAPFLAYRPGDRRAERLRAHAREDARRGQRHPPRRAAALSRDEIVRTAIRVADAEGAEAVNMRRIARELGSGTMSLYWHVASKDELLDMMIDAIVGEAQAPEPSGDWRADLRAGACTTRDALHRHQWAVNFMSTRPPAGPKMLRNLERSLGALDGLVTFLILKGIGLFMKLRIPDEELEIGDVAVHGEEAYPTEELVRVGAAAEIAPARPARSNGEGARATEKARQTE